MPDLRIYDLPLDATPETSDMVMVDRPGATSRAVRLSTLRAVGSMKFDLLSPLAQDEVAITGAAELTSGRMHVCSGTTADYTVTLPTATGNMGEIVGVRMASGLTKLVTVQGAGAELINGQNTRLMHDGEAATLLCDGEGWNKIAGVSRGIFISARDGGYDQPIASDAIITLDLSTSISDKFSNVDLSANTLTIPRTSVWQAFFSASLFDFSAGSGAVDSGITLNGATSYRRDRRNVIYAGGGTATQCYPVMNVNVALNSGDVITPTIFVAGATAKTLAGGNNVYSIIALTEIPSW